MTTTASRRLTLDDILDARAYERERPAMRERVMALKQRRRVHVGTLVTVTFENRETMRYQIQEMARVERIFTDDGILEELAAYNPMVPEPGHLCATLFIELTTDDQVREWLPALVGIETHVRFVLPGGDTVRCDVDPQHAAQLTREHATAAVHYLSFAFSTEQVAACAAAAADGGMRLEIDHPRYPETVDLAPSTIAELLTDLQPD